MSETAAPLDLIPPSTPDAARILYGPGGIPDWTSTRQVPADCWFVAAAAALAHRRPAEIVRMIVPGADGRYTVRFPEAIRMEVDIGGDYYLLRDCQPITVAAPDPAEGYSGSWDGSTWLGVLEKAYAETLYRNQRRRAGRPRDLIHGVHSLQEGIRALTGHRADGDWLWPSWLTRKHTTRAKLRAAFRHDRIVTAGTLYFAGRRGRRELARNGLAARHVYSVIDYDAAADRLLLRNPWGGTPPLPGGDGVATGAAPGGDGMTWIALDDFYACFVEIGYEQGS